jgi:RNA polymerase sigma factor (sigma-70 family)
LVEQHTRRGKRCGTGLTRGVLAGLRRVAAPGGHAGTTDAELLERYANHRDEAAFELLVWRHGRMVLAVCRRVLRDEHAAEDAFQATFLALARRAAAISRRGAVAGWLFRVARRAAADARLATARRADRAVRAVARRPSPVVPDPVAEAAGREEAGVIDELVDGLPDRYRAPLVVCYYAGRTNAEAARELRCPVGTLESRLTRGRALLAERMAGRGLVLPGGLATAAAAVKGPATASVAAAVRAADLVAAGTWAVPGAIPPAVTALTHGVLGTVLMTKIRTGVAGGVVAALLVTAGGWAARAGGELAGMPGPAGAGTPQPSAEAPGKGIPAASGAAPADARNEAKDNAVAAAAQLDGSYTVAEAITEDGGPGLTAAELRKCRFVIKAGVIICTTGDGKQEAVTFTLDPSRARGEIDLKPVLPEGTEPAAGAPDKAGGISRVGKAVTGSPELTIAMTRGVGVRPKNFEGKGPGEWVIRLVRDRK